MEDLITDVEVFEPQNLKNETNKPAVYGKIKESDFDNINVPRNISNLREEERETLLSINNGKRSVWQKRGITMNLLSKILRGFSEQ